MTDTGIQGQRLKCRYWFKRLGDSSDQSILDHLKFMKIG